MKIPTTKTSQKLFSWWCQWSDNFDEETCRKFELIIHEVEQMEKEIKSHSSLGRDDKQLKGG